MMILMSQAHHQPMIPSTGDPQPLCQIRYLITKVLQVTGSLTFYVFAFTAAYDFRDAFLSWLLWRKDLFLSKIWYANFSMCQDAKNAELFFMPLHQRIGHILFYHCPPVLPSVCLLYQLKVKT